MVADCEGEQVEPNIVLGGAVTAVYCEVLRGHGMGAMVGRPEQ